MQTEGGTMHCTAELRCTVPWQLTAVRRRYKTFMIDEILSKETCGYYEKLSMWPVRSFLPRPKHLLSFSESSMLFYPLLSIIAHQDDNLTLLSQSSSPNHPPLLPHPSPLSPLHPPAECLSSKTPASISSESEVEQCSTYQKKARHSRTIFSDHQLYALEKKFQKQKYLSTPDRLDLARTLVLTQVQVKTWYQNRRMKWKKMVLKRGQKAPTKPKGRPKKNSIPTTEEIEEEERLAQLALQDMDLTHASGPGDMPQALHSKSHNPPRPEGSSQERAATEKTDVLVAS